MALSLASTGVYAVRRISAALAAASFGVTSAFAADTIKVGVLHSLSGTMAISKTVLKDSVGNLVLIKKAETDVGIKVQLALLKAAVLISSSDKTKRLAAAQLLVDSDQPATKSLLIEQLATETEPEVTAALNKTLSAVAGRLAWGERFGVPSTGTSSRPSPSAPWPAPWSAR